MKGRTVKSIVFAVVLLGVAAGLGTQHFLWSVYHSERGEAAVSPDGVYVARPFALDEGDVRPYGHGIYVRHRLTPWSSSTLVFAAYCAPDLRVAWRSSGELVVHCEVTEETPVMLPAPSGITVIHANGGPRGKGTRPAAATSQAHAASSLSDRELALGGVALSDSEQHVIAKLGPPQRVVDTGEGRRIDYPGLTLWTGLFDNDATTPRLVDEIFSTSAKHCTPAGICPGMPVPRATAVYGAAHVAEREDGVFLEYGVDESSCWLQIAAANDVIISIRAECQP